MMQATEIPQHPRSMERKDLDRILTALRLVESCCGESLALTVSTGRSSFSFHFNSQESKSSFSGHAPLLTDERILDFFLDTVSLFDARVTRGEPEIDVEFPHGFDEAPFILAALFQLLFGQSGYRLAEAIQCLTDTVRENKINISHVIKMYEIAIEDPDAHLDALV